MLIPAHLLQLVASQLRRLENIKLLVGLLTEACKYKRAQPYTIPAAVTMINIAPQGESFSSTWFFCRAFIFANIDRSYQWQRPFKPTIDICSRLHSKVPPRHVFEPVASQSEDEATASILSLHNIQQLIAALLNRCSDNTHASASVEIRQDIQRMCALFLLAADTLDLASRARLDELIKKTQFLLQTSGIFDSLMSVDSKEQNTERFYVV